MECISKRLTQNDLGLTGSHQSGILVPKRNEILAFFPEMDSTKKNPRYKLTFKDDSGEAWVFYFIYYNNKIFGGTRNEYRLTCMTKFLRSNNLTVDDEVVFVKTDTGYFVKYNKVKSVKTDSLVLSPEWKVVKIK